MKIPLGTASTRLHRVGRWVFVGTVVVAAAMPEAGVRPWTFLTVGWMLAWTIWMLESMIRGRSWVPGHPGHIAILSVALVFAWHVGAGLGDRRPQVGLDMPGLLNASMLFHLALLSLGVFLTQAFLGEGVPWTWTRLCGAALTFSAATAMFLGRSEASNPSLLLTLLAGLFVIATPRWTHRRRRPMSSTARAVGFLVIGAASALILGVTLLWWRAGQRPIWCPPAGLFGRGEMGFTLVSGSDSGSAVLAITAGWVGWGLFVLGLFGIAMIWIVRRAANGSACIWAIATCLSTLAILAPGGYFLPISAAGFALTWGRWAPILRRPHRRRPGWVVVIAMVILFSLLGVTRYAGLLMAMSDSFELTDKNVHATLGFLLAMVLAWWLGSKRAWLALTGVALAAGVGGLAELAQRTIAVGRYAELADWRAHAVGSGTALMLVVFCLFCRRSEPVRVSARAAGKEKPFSEGIGWLLAAILLGAGACWFARGGCEAVHSWRTTPPRFVVSDGMGVTGRNDYAFRGMIVPKLLHGGFPLITVSPTQIQRVYNSPERISVRLFDKGPGLHTQWVKGLPFGRFSSLREQTVQYLLFSSDTPVLAVDTELVLAPAQEATQGLEAGLRTLSRNHAVIFFYTGDPIRYRTIRRLLQVRCPEIPCILRVPPAEHRIDVLADIARYAVQTPQNPLAVLTHDRATALSACKRLGRRGRIHLLGPEGEGLAPQPGLSCHANLAEFLLRERRANRLTNSQNPRSMETGATRTSP